MSLVCICVFYFYDMRAEMDQIASQHEPTVVFLWLLHVSLLACLPRAVCVVSENLAGCQQVRVACLLLISSSAPSSAPFGCLEQVWGTHTFNFPRQGIGSREQGFSASLSELSTAYSYLQFF